jgi:hypothetical protein
MNAERIKDAIRKLNRSDKIAMYRWIDVYRWLDQDAPVHLLLMIGMPSMGKSPYLHGRN